LFFVGGRYNMGEETYKKYKIMRDPRIKKRILIITAYVAIFLTAVFLVYGVVSKDPTCSDGNQNQNEKGVDCGGTCSPCRDISASQDISVVESDFVFGGNDTYDALVRISNSNSSVGASSFSYKASLKDASGAVLDEKTGKGFVMPAESKYLIILGFSVSGNDNPSSLDFVVSEVKWEEFTKYQKPQLGVYSKRFSLLSDIVGGEAYGVLRNESGFDFASIKVNVILRDSANKPLALNTTVINTVKSGEERDFKLIWPYQLPGEVKNIETEAEADTYNTQNFIKTYVPDRSFQFQQ